MNVPLSIQPLAQAIEQFKLELQTAANPISYPIAWIAAWLKENEGVLRSQPSLYRDLVKLWTYVEHWDGVAPERWQVLARIQLLMKARLIGWSREEEILNEIEAEVTPDFFPPFKRFEGRIVYCSEQLDTFAALLLSYERGRLISIPPAQVTHYTKRAQWIVDRVLIENLVHLQLLENRIPENESVTANEWRKRLASEKFPQAKEMDIKGPFSPELALLSLNKLMLHWSVAISVGQMFTLRTLHVTKLSTFPTHILKLTQLENLIIANGIEQVDIPEGISALGHLTKLSLNNNQLKTLPESISRLTKLENLFLENNLFTTIPEPVMNLTTLKSLSFEGFKLKECSASISKLVHLTELYLRATSIQTFPPSLSLLTHLIRFNATHSPLRSFPPLNSSNISSLDLRNMHIDEIPSSIGVLKGLSVLQMENNPVECVAEEIGACTALTLFYCDANVVPFIPDTLTKCEALLHVGPQNNNRWSKNQGPLLNYLEAARLHRTLKKFP